MYILIPATSSAPSSTSRGEERIQLKRAFGNAVKRCSQNVGGWLLRTRATTCTSTASSAAAASSAGGHRMRLEEPPDRTFVDEG
jgi:hypothetical protein